MQGGKTAANLLQREFAKYGDRNGTRTGDKVAVAAKRFENIILYDTWLVSLEGLRVKQLYIGLLCNKLICYI